MKNHPDQQARNKMLEKKEIFVKPPPYPVYNSNKTGFEYNSTSFPIGVKVTNNPILKVKKLHKNAIVPTKANLTDAGYDLYALDGAILQKHTHQLVKTGVSLEIPEGYVGLIWPRSGLSYKHGLDVFAGVIDSGYRGDVGVILYNSQYNSYTIEAGDRIAQIIFQKVESFDLIETENLDSSQRGLGGFGSSGS
jgi:dUTP pyrophosphatase